MAGLVTLEHALTAAPPNASGAADVSGSKLSGLQVGSAVGSTVVRLTAKNARLASLEGVATLSGALQWLDVSENSIRSLDLRTAGGLAHCIHLHTLVCAQNNISFVDFSSIPLAPAMRRAWSSLRVLDLSCNLLTEFPAIACCTHLTQLTLDENRIAHIGGLEELLPRSIEKLSIAKNAIQDWHDLWALLHLTDCLQELSLEGNPCMDLALQDGFDIAMFAVAVMATLSSFNGASITEAQRMHSADILDQLDSSSPRAQTLELLRHVCPALPANTVTEVHGLVALTDFNELSAKVQKLGKVVNVLRAVDKQKKVPAAVKIQATVRMFFVRHAFEKKYHRRLPRWDDHCPQLKPKVALWQSRAMLTRMVNRVEAIEAAVRQVWVDQAHFRGYLHSKRVFAAITIQKYWRGSLARRKYHAIRVEFIKFAENFKPAVVKIQSFARMVIAKRLVRPMRRQSKRQRELEAQITVLRSEVKDLKALVLQLVGQAQGGLHGAESRARANLLISNSMPAPQPTPSSATAAPVTAHRAAIGAATVADVAPAPRTATSTGRGVVAALRAESPAVPSSSSPSPLDGTSPEAKDPKTGAPSTVQPQVTKPTPTAAVVANTSARRVPPPVPLEDVPAHLKPSSAAGAVAALNASASTTLQDPDPLVNQWRRYGTHASIESTISPVGSTNSSTAGFTTTNGGAALRTTASEATATSTFRPHVMATATVGRPPKPGQPAGVGQRNEPTVHQPVDHRVDGLLEDEDEVRYEDDAFDDDDVDSAAGFDQDGQERDIDFGGVVSTDDARYARYSGLTAA